MNREIFLLVAAALLFITLTTHANIAPASAQSGSASAVLSTSYDLTWSTIDGGGGTSSGGAYSLSGSIGQPDAGTLMGGTYTLGGGFWGGAPTLFNLSLPLIVR